MTEEPHNIPEWYIPQEEVILANEHERERIEEHGELDEPLCPHCGSPYLSKSGDSYTHHYVDVKPDTMFDDRELKPGVVCVDGEQRIKNGWASQDRGFPYDV